MQAIFMAGLGIFIAMFLAAHMIYSKPDNDTLNVSLLVCGYPAYLIPFASFRDAIIRELGSIRGTARGVES